MKTQNSATTLGGCLRTCQLRTDRRFLFQVFKSVTHVRTSKTQTPSRPNETSVLTFWSKSHGLFFTNSLGKCSRYGNLADRSQSRTTHPAELCGRAEPGSSACTLHTCRPADCPQRAQLPEESTSHKMQRCGPRACNRNDTASEWSRRRTRGSFSSTRRGSNLLGGCFRNASSRSRAPLKVAWMWSTGAQRTTSGCAAAATAQAGDPGRTRTCNPRLRGPMPYPLGHEAILLVIIRVP